MTKYLDTKIFLNIIFFLGVIYFSLHYKQKLDQFDKNYVDLTQQGYELDLMSNHLKSTLKKSMIHIRFNNDLIINEVKNINRYIYTLNQQKEKFKNYKKSFQFIQEYKKSFKNTEEDIYQFMRYNAKVSNSILYLEDQLNYLENYEKGFQKKLLYSLTFFINQKYDFSNNSILDEESMKFFQNYSSKDLPYTLTISHIQLLSKEIPSFKNIFVKIENSSIFTHVEDFKSSIVQESKEVQNQLQQQFWIFILVFVLSSILFIYYTIKSKKDHENILALTKENEKNLRYDKLTDTLSRAAFNEDEKKDNIIKAILIDIKQFSKINSMIGYDGGDYILQQLSKVLSSFGEVYRVGADKFIISTLQNQDNIAIALEIHEAVQNLDIIYKEFSLPVNIYLGITDTKPFIKTAELAISNNRSNNDVINIYNASMDDSQSAKQNIEMLQKVNKALKEDHIRPFFQPIVCLNSKQPIKYESLVRLIDGDKALSPYFFLDITKGSSTYQSITKTVLKKSMEFVQNKNIGVSINISFEDIEDQNTINYINFFLMKHKKFAHYVTFELLESEHISNFKIVENFIKMVKAHGCLIAIDDFGSGYSNFEYLFNLEPDIIKIDGSLIKDINTNQKSRIIVESILNLAKKSHIKTVAEFVDSEDVDRIITELGVDYGQGYFYSPPIDILK